MSEQHFAEIERFATEHADEWDVAMLNDVVAEVRHLREQMGEWESFHAAEVEMRRLIEAHMDTGRGQWECVDQIERLRHALHELLKAGQHDGPCTNEDNPWEECDLHLAASNIRKRRARELLESAR